MKFYPPGSLPVHISLTSGHSARVEPEGTELEPRFHAQAAALGCSLTKATAAAANPEPGRNRRARIKSALSDMIAGSDQDDFLPNGKPNKSRLDARLGFTSDRDEMESVFEEILAEGDDEKEDGNPEGGEPGGESESQEKANPENESESPDLSAQFEAMTRPQLMKWLKKKKVEYETDANKKALVKLAIEAALEEARK